MVFAAGCCTPRDEAVLFRRKNAEEAAHYQVLEPASLSSLIHMESSYLGAMKGLIAGVEKRKDNPKELENYLRCVKQKVTACENLCGEYEAMKKRLENDGGALYYYESRRVERTTDKTSIVESSGFIIIKDGRIIYRSSL